jgi:hypothetical protein
MQPIAADCGCRLDQCIRQYRQQTAMFHKPCDAAREGVRPPAGSLCPVHGAHQMRLYLQRYLLQNAYGEVHYEPTKQQLRDPAYSDLVQPVLRSMNDRQTHVHQASCKQYPFWASIVCSGSARKHQSSARGARLSRLKTLASALLARAWQMLGGINAQEHASQFASMQLQAARNAGASVSDAAKCARGHAARCRCARNCTISPPLASTWKGQVRADFIIASFLASYHLAKCLFTWR